MIFSMIIITVLGIISFQDLKSRELPLWLIIGCGVLSAGKVIYLLAKGQLVPAEMLISLVPGALLLLTSYVTRQGVGYGDGLLALCIGPAVGAPALVTGMCVAVITSGLFSAVMLVLRKAGRGTKIPFVPFMTFGLGVMLLAPI